MPDKDDLRFGDIGSGGDGEDDIVDRVRTAIILIVLIYVGLKLVEILFNVPIPFV